MPPFIDQGKFTVVVHEEDGSYWAEVLEMPGVFVSGDSMKEIEDALEEAMSLYMTSRNVTVTFHDLKMEEVGSDDGGRRYEVKIPA